MTAHRPSRLVRFWRWLRPAVVFFALAASSLAWVSSALYLFCPTTQAYAVQGGARRAVQLPWEFHEVAKGRVVEVELRQGALATRRWQVVPDDELVALQIDGRDVSLAGYSRAQLTDWQQGFALDLAEYGAGSHAGLRVTVSNGGGNGGLKLRPLLGWRWGAVALGFLPWVLALGRAFGVRRGQWWVLIAALGVYTLYWAATPWHVRAHDEGFTGGGHMGYVAYVAKHLHLPNPKAGWAFYHPGLYYVLGASVWRLAEALQLPPMEMMQGLSLALWLVYVTAAAGALRVTLRSPSLRLTATAAVVLWPSSMLHSIRIGNDAALYAAVGAATWCITHWWQRRRDRHLLGAAFFVGLALVAKSNAAVLVAALLGVIALRTLRGGHWLRWRKLRVLGGVAVLLATGAALNMGNAIYHYLRGNTSDWLVGNVALLDKGLRVPNTVEAFLPLDIPTFLTEPWMGPRDDSTGRGNFWNYLLRTSLVGEFQFADEVARGISLLQGALLLGLLLLLVRRWRLNVRALWRDLPWALLGGLWVASLIALRIKAPYSCSGDFRYIVPALVPMVVLWTRLGRLPRVMLWAMTLSGMVFAVNLAAR